MKGMLYTFLAVLVIVGAGIGLSVYTHFDFADGVAQAKADGVAAGTDRGYLDGIRDGSEDGYQEVNRNLYLEANNPASGDDAAGNYYYLYNPTYEEVRSYFSGKEFRSFNELHEFLLTGGIRSGYVRCYLTDTVEGNTLTYELAVFETRDKGQVFIEPWSGYQVDLTEGGYYDGEGLDPERLIIDKVIVVW